MKIRSLILLAMLLCAAIVPAVADSPLPECFENCPRVQ